MKRSTHPEDSTQQDKKSKGSSLAFLGQALHKVKAYSSSESWHAAKEVVAEPGAVQVTHFVSADTPRHNGGGSAGEAAAVCIQAHVSTANLENAAAFPHLKASSSTQSAVVAVRLVLCPSSGQLLDADTSCCPGAFQPVLGSFCPHAAAALLHVAKQAQLPEEGAMPAPLVRVDSVCLSVCGVGKRPTPTALKTNASLWTR